MSNSTRATLRGAKNFLTTEVAVCEPWSFQPNVPADAIADKEKYTQWRSLPKTEHLVYFGVEGVNPNIRPNGKTNPVRRLHAIIADYDAHISDVDFDTILDRVPANYKPTWIHRTMHSGGVRVIWLLEAPICLDAPKLAKEFTKVVYDALNINKLFAGADPGFHDLTKPWDVGKNWKHLGNNVLSSNTLEYWLFEAAAKMREGDLGDINIPIEDIAEEVERRWPGRFGNQFKVGNRGVAFWVPEATNPTAAIVTPNGMICYSTEKLFYSWLELLGAAFISQYQEDKIGGAVKGMWYDGKGYYWRSSFGTWERYTQENAVVKLKTKFKLDPRLEKSNTHSEIDQALFHIQETKRVSGVFPSIYNPEEVVYSNGKRYLNIATVKPLQYADTPQEWGENFPWLARFMSECFTSDLVHCVSSSTADPMPAKEIFLCWSQRAYVSALSGRIEKGQAMLVAGGVNLGKTLLSQKIVGGLLGGFSDASDFLTVNTQFNKELLEVGLWCIDDAVASQDPAQHQKFSEMMKRFVANPQVGYRAMYADLKVIVWNGRIFVTLNDDISSIRMIPNLDSSLADKLIVLRFADVVRTFPPSGKLEDTIARELPFFARWLLDWTPPIQLTEGAPKRFGMHSYIDDLLRVKSLHAGGVADVMELKALWLKRSGNFLREQNAKKGNKWSGSVSEWYAVVSEDDALKPLISKFTVRQLGRKFVEASRIAGSGITVEQGKSNNGNVYYIDLGPRDEGTSTGA